jgi:hypothetical protein
MQNFAEPVHEDPTVHIQAQGNTSVDCRGHCAMLWYYMDLRPVFVRVTVFVGSHLFLKWFGL